MDELRPRNDTIIPKNNKQRGISLFLGTLNKRARLRATYSRRGLPRKAVEQKLCLHTNMLWCLNYGGMTSTAGGPPTRGAHYVPDFGR